MKYLETERGNRLYPKRSSRVYWHLTSLRKIFEKILKDDLIGFNDILDYGCGNKPYMELFKKVINNYVGADIEGNELADVILNNDGTLPLKNESFDCILSSQVLEHVESTHTYLSEAYRVLKKGGKLILSTHGIWQYHPDPNDYWRWTCAGLKKIIEEKGFSVEKMYSVQNLPSISIQLWQDATIYKLPRILRNLYVLICQFMMEFIDKRQGEKFNDNAGVFIVVAKKM